MDSYIIANDLKVHHLQSNFGNLNRKLSALLEFSKHAASEIPISTTLPISAPTHLWTPFFISRSGSFSSSAPSPDDDLTTTSSVLFTSLSSAPATSIIFQNQHRLDASTRAMLNLDLKRLNQKAELSTKTPHSYFFNNGVRMLLPGEQSLFGFCWRIQPILKVPLVRIGLV